MTTRPKLDQYEKKVDKAIREIIAPYKKRLDFKVENIDVGIAWKIVPKNPEAASITVYGIDPYTIDVSVDEVHWLEMFMNTEKWDKELDGFMKRLTAIMDGKVTGWCDKAAANYQFRGKTLLEIYLDDDKPDQWVGNLLFRKHFKKRRDVIKRDYESY